MAFDGVPWFVGDGAVHSPEIARLLAYAATAGGEGVVGPGDLKVTQRPVVGGGVSIAPGGLVLLNRSTGGSQQSYVGRNPTAWEGAGTAIAPTGSGSGRADAVAARVEDPQYSPWPPLDPSLKAAGPYLKPFVYSNVDPAIRRTPDLIAALGLNYTVYLLGLVVLPASTANVLDSHITDCRDLAHPRQTSELLTSPASVFTLNSTSYVTFGGYSPTVRVPLWATHVTMIVHFSGVVPANFDDIFATLRARIALSSSDPAAINGPEQVVDLNIVSSATGGGQTVGFHVAIGSTAVPASHKGKVVNLLVQGKDGALAGHDGRLATSGNTQVSFDVRFQEKVT